MYQVLLVDDEPVILRNISKVIDWEKFGFSICATAECGEEACRLLKEYRPNLVITDVMMPQMNGIELAEFIGENYPKTEVIIISGYDEFDFARSAMRAGVMEYIMKPTKKEELEQALQKVYERIQRKADLERNIRELREEAEKNIPILKNQFFSELADKIIPEGQNLMESLKYYGSELKGDPFRLWCFDLDREEILLNEEGIPVVCETDIHGAVTALLMEAAGMDEARTFFADWTVRHPDNENGELLQHCGPWPVSVAKEKPSIGYPLAFDHPGAVEAEAKHGDMTLCRFDGDNGEYSLLLGHAKGVEGPYTKGTYVWVEVENLKRLEAKLVEGPYIHHCVGIHKDVVPVLYEACKYIGVKPDLYDPVEEQVKAYLRGEWDG